MSTLVCFHAHPDDEAISTGGLMASAAAAGHRVVLVCATRGEVGEPQEGVLEAGEELWERRMVELAASAAILGADEPRWLGYHDSGMIGEDTNDAAGSFWTADLDEATNRLADILTEVDADVLTIYDENGGYGHPDHIMVHRVGLAAAAQAGVTNVYEATMNRTEMQAMIEAQPDMFDDDEGESDDRIDVESMGTPAADISYRISVGEHIEKKRASMVAHRSQIGPDSIFLTMPDEIFATAFGSEWFNVPGTTDTGGPTDVALLPGLT